MSYTREELEETPANERPTVRCRVLCKYTDENRLRQSKWRDREGKIIVDGNNPWVEIHAGGRTIAERFSWGLVCQVLNNPRESPISFNEISDTR